MEPPAISVVLPSYGRPKELVTCLSDLGRQDIDQRYEVLLVHRPDDDATREAGAAFTPAVPLCQVRAVPVNEPGIVAAMRAGVKHATGRCVAFCDDDVRYGTEWLRRIVALLDTPNVGGAGGRILEGGDAPTKSVNPNDVASVSWWGRTLYDVRSAPTFRTPCRVAMLPGASMCFRRCAIRVEDFDPRLDGPGSSPGQELAVCWAVRKRGYELLYDPTLCVRHYPAPWVDDARGQSFARTWTYSRNACYLMARNLSPFGRVCFCAYFFLLGQRESPGIVGWCGLRWRAGAPHDKWLRASLSGKLRGWRMARATRHGAAVGMDAGRIHVSVTRLRSAAAEDDGRGEIENGA